MSIYAKLLKIQSELPSFDKDSTNPHFKSKFASLPAILSAALPILRANGVLLTNHASHDECGNYVKVTLTDVESNESVSSMVPMIKIDSMQLVGQAFTYAQRYGFLSLMGVCADLDDDGESLSGRGAKPKDEKPIDMDALVGLFNKNKTKLGEDQLKYVEDAIDAYETKGIKLSLSTYERIMKALS